MIGSIHTELKETRARSCFWWSETEGVFHSPGVRSVDVTLLTSSSTSLLCIVSAHCIEEDDVENDSVKPGYNTFRETARVMKFIFQCCVIYSCKMKRNKKSGFSGNTLNCSVSMLHVTKRSRVWLKRWVGSFTFWEKASILFHFSVSGWSY